MTDQCIECGVYDDSHDFIVEAFPTTVGGETDRCHECYGDYLANHTNLDSESAQVAAVAYLGYSNADIEAVVGSGTDVRETRREIFQTTGHSADDLEGILRAD